MQRESNLSIWRKQENTGTRTTEFGPIVGVLIGIPLLAIAAAISIPVALIWGRLSEHKQRRFGKKMSRGGRTISLDQLSKAIRERKGTVIFEYRTPHKGPIRRWWTAEDVYARTP
jgi:hypothetical protein